MYKVNGQMPRSLLTKLNTMKLYRVTFNKHWVGDIHISKKSNQYNNNN